MGTKPNVRLHFETEKPRLPSKLTHAVMVGSRIGTHQQISKNEKENIGVEAGHKAEETAEIIVRSSQRTYQSRKIRSRRKTLSKSMQSDLSNATTNKASRWQQKQAIKKEYAVARRGTGSKTAKPLADTARRGGRKAADMARKAIALILKNPKGLLIVVALFLVMAAMMYFLSSCSQLFLGSLNTFLSTSYTADDPEICAADLEFTRLEAQLEYSIQNVAHDHPGYDEYRYSIGRIGHNPYVLLAYLTSKFEGFTFDEIRSELDSIYSAMYSVSFRPETEVRYRTETHTYSYTVIDQVTSESSIKIETYDVSVPYDYYILNIGLNSRQMDSVLVAKMNDEQREMYQVYMDTRGNKAYLGNPFSFNWQSQVSCLYGWRVHPINHNLQLHRGLDLAEPVGTPIHSVHSGKVIKVGYDSDGFGNYVSVEDGEGYRSTYAHCNNISVQEGQIVTQGETIATVGNTGVSTGSHLHLELSYHGEYMNPYFFIGNDDS